MKKRELRSFRAAARRALRRGVRKGTITRTQRGALLVKLANDETAEEMADVALNQAVICGKITEAAANSGDAIEWGGFLDDVDWAKLVDFILTVILPMFL